MSPFLSSSHPHQPLVSTTEPGLEACRKSFGIFPFLPSRDIPVPFPAAPLHFARVLRVRVSHSSHNPPDTPCLSWERLFCSEAGHMVGCTQPLLLKQHLALLQENPKSSSVWGGKLHCFLQTRFSLLISAYRFPRCPAAPCPGGCESSPGNTAQTGCTSSAAPYHHQRSLRTFPDSFLVCLHCP